MKSLPIALFVAALIGAPVIAAPAQAQRMPRGPEFQKMLQDHIDECEVCAGFQQQIEKTETELEALEAEKEALRLKRLEQRIDQLTKAQPELKDQLEALLEQRKKIVDLQEELDEAANTSRNLLADLDLEPDDLTAVAELFGPPDGDRGGDRRWQGGDFRQPGDPQLVRFHNQRARLMRAGDRNPEAASQLERLEAQKKRRFDELKQNDPELYQIMAKEDALIAKLSDLHTDLQHTAIEHIRNAQQQN